ncbi:NUDIX domain-containing protein [Candidatus Woesearchaeota archaeon]|nr:NUDIX domain-containing protein [Candidatus Woesearchaeota archaeon]
MDPNKAHYVVVTGIVVKDGKFLIAKRAPHEKAFPNKWTVPGGKVEVHDYKSRPKDTDSHWYNVLEKVLRREVLEETGLKIKNIKYLTSLVFERPDNIPVVVISLYADHAEGDVKLSPDLTEHRWITLEEAKEYDFISGIYEEIVMLDKVMKGEYEGEWDKSLLQ